MSAHLVLICAALSSLGYLHYTQFSKSPGGDAGIGHTFATYAFLQAFVICMGIVTLLIGAKGGFSWLGGNSIMRFFIVLACIR